MAFDIEKMKADGVEERLIDWIQMDTASKSSLVARRLEQDALFKQFLQENEADIDKYAVSAGLLSKADREWIADKNNPYKYPDCEHTDLGTLYYCGGLQSGDVLHDAGAEIDDGEDWGNMITGASSGEVPPPVEAYLVYDNGSKVYMADWFEYPHSIGFDISSDEGMEQVLVTLTVSLDPEVGVVSSVDISCGDPGLMPSHYAIYFKNNVD